MKTAANLFGFNLFINSDNTVSLFSNTNSGLAISDNGGSTYSTDKREFYLNYNYVDAGGLDCEVTDTLIFRNRMLDGVNQWSK